MMKKITMMKVTKKVVALGLCVSMLVSQPVFAGQVEGKIKDSGGTTLGTTYVAAAKHTADAYTAPKISNGKYKYKSRVQLHVYTIIDGQYFIIDDDDSRPANGTKYARMTCRTSPNMVVKSVASAHSIWKNSVEYKKSHNVSPE